MPRALSHLWYSVVLAVVLSACSVIRSDETPTAHVNTVAPLEIPIQTAPEILAGSPLTVTLGPVDLSEGTPVTVIFNHSYGVRTYTAALVNGSANLVIPANDTIRSGFTTITAVSGVHRGSTNLNITADKPIEPIVPLVGSDTIIADGNHWSIAAVLPYDRYLNPVDTGTIVNMRVRHPDGQQDNFQVLTDNLVAWQRIFSGLVAGKTTISVESEGSFGPVAEIQEIPGWPVDFSIIADPPTIPADGRQLVVLTTSELRDSNGNVVPDGTAVVFTVSEPATGRARRINAFTVSGVAKASLQAPSVPQTVSIQATVYHQSSTPLGYNFTPDVTTFPVDLALGEAENLLVNAGPILGELQQFVPDGTSGELRITRNGEVIFVGETEVNAGYANFDIRLSKLDYGQFTATVDVGGIVVSEGFTLQP